MTGPLHLIPHALAAALMVGVSGVAHAADEAKNGCEKVTCPAVNSEFALHLPNPDSCTSFCKCDWGVAHYFDCPPPLEFNAELQVCDWASNANCEHK